MSGPPPPPPGALAATRQDTGAVQAGKPRIRGWLHAAMAPVALAAGIALIVGARTGTGRIADAVYTACGLVLFTTSAVYHRGRWGSIAAGRLRRADHGNIYLLIAGTFTPLVVLGLAGFARTALLWEVWTAATAGVGAQWLWPSAPRAFHTVLYVVTGWSLAPAFGELLARSGAAVLTLTIAGGLLYTAGAVVYATRRPDPAPAWFGFHEVFHACTVAAWTCQYIAISLLTCRP
jgi:hemolysin III